MFQWSSFSIVAVAVLTSVLCEGQFSICQYDQLVLGEIPSVSPKSFQQIPDFVPVNSTVVTFHSPLSSENISNTQECILQVRGSGIIQMNVSTFDLGGQDPCNPSVEHISISFYQHYMDRLWNGYPVTRVEANRGYTDTVRWCGQSYSTRLETRQRMIIRYFAGPETMRGKGFSISFSQVNHFTCGHGEESVGEQPMYIFSPGYPAVYDNNMDNLGHPCNWQLKGLHRRSLLLETERFSLEPHNACSYDFLQINGDKYCGDHRIQIQSKRDIFNIAFFSDRSKQFDGFVLKIVEMPEDVAPCKHHVTASTSPVSLQLPSLSPGQFYAIDCWWLLDAGKDDHVVLLENTRFHTTASCTEFELRIYDGQNQTQATRILSSCAPVEMFHTVRSSSRYLYMDVGIRVTGSTVTTIDVVYMVTSQHRDAVPRLLYAGFAESLVWINLVSWNDLGLLVRGGEEDVGNYSTCLQLSLKEFPSYTTSLSVSDYFYVFSGWNESFAELGKACGRSSSELLISRGSKMYIVVRQNLNTTRQHVWLNYQLRSGHYCEPDMVLLRSFGNVNRTLRSDVAYTSVVPSHMSPSVHYANNAVCRWLILPQDHTSFVQATTTYSSLWKYHCVDNVTAYDYQVASGSRSKLLEWCGSELPVIMSSKGNSLLLQFATDATNTSVGFSVNYSSVLLVNRCPSMAVVKAERTRQFLSSPNYPFNYPNGLDCRWRIEARRGVIKLTLLDVFISPEGTVCSLADFLVVYDGWDRSGRILADLCSNKTGSAEMTSTGTYMLVHFHSNSGGTARGFRLQYETTDDSNLVHCNGQVFVTNDEDREVTSPYHPQPYPGNTDCYWIVRGPLTHVVMLEVIAMDLPCDSPVILYDGSSDNSLMMASLCGTRYQRQYVTSQKSLYIRFRSTSNNGHHGFKFRLRSWKSDGACTGSVAHLMAYSNKRFITSPGYPANYPPNSDCNWRIESTNRNMSVLVEIEDAQFEESVSCLRDSLTVYDGYGMGSKEIGKYCGDNSASFLSSETYLYLHFVSDDRIAYKGFRLSYKMVHHRPSPTTPVPGHDLSSDSGVIIGGVMGGVAFLITGITLFLCCLGRCRRSRSSSQAEQTSGRQRAGSTVFVMNPVIVNQMAPPPPYPGLTNTSFVGDDRPPAYPEAAMSFLPHLDAPPSYSEAMLESHPPSPGTPTGRGHHSSPPRQGEESGHDSLAQNHADSVESSRESGFFRDGHDADGDYQNVLSATSREPPAQRWPQGAPYTQHREGQRGSPQERQQSLLSGQAGGQAAPRSPPPQPPPSSQPPPPQHRRQPRNRTSRPQPPPAYQPRSPGNPASHSLPPHRPPPPPPPPPGPPPPSLQRWSCSSRPAQGRASPAPPTQQHPDPETAAAPSQGLPPQAEPPSPPEDPQRCSVAPGEDPQRCLSSANSDGDQESSSYDRAIRLDSFEDIGTSV